MILRQNNLNPERPDVGFLRTLDSSIKRNTSSIEQREGLMEDLCSVNLSKFVSEAVTAICDAKLQAADIQATVKICSLLHQRYKDFSPSLVQGLVKVFFPGNVAEDVDVDRNARAMKKCSTLKHLLEIYFVGVLEDASIFVNIVKDLTSVEHLKDRDATHTNLSLLASFARQERYLLGLPLAGQDILEELFKALNVTTDQKKLFRKAFQTYYDAAVELLQSEHDSLRQMEHENEKILSTKGELNEENASAYEKLWKSYDQLYRGISGLAEALDMQPPVMPEDGHTTRVTSGEDASSPGGSKASFVLEALWDDEDTRVFYECLLDLKTFVHVVLLGEAEPKLSEQSAKDSAPDADETQTVAQKTADGDADAGAKDKEKTKEKSKEKDKEPDKEKTRENEVEFCYLNSKSSRKKLVRALFNVPRTLLELFPYYSRMVSTLSTCIYDVSSILLQLLEEEFNFLINKKYQMNIETKIRNICFIGELNKFRIAPPDLVFSCLRSCLDDFSYHNIDVACNLLEICGHFLYRSPETTIRMANMLELLIRLKNVKNLDPLHITLVENAYYLCNPPERSAHVSKVRKLLLSDLDKSLIEHVLRQLRKLSWSECEAYLFKCFMKVHRGKYTYCSHAFPGQLYNYELIGSSVIFDTLYLILVFFHGTSENHLLPSDASLSFFPQQDVLDPLEDYFRIRMVITLLETCGHYFDRGSSKKKLDRFLIHFQIYILNKGVLPLDIEFDLQDLFAELCPNMMIYASIEEVNDALVDLEEHERIVTSEKANNEKHSEIEKIPSRTTSVMSVNGQSLANGIEENGLHEEIMEIESDSESGTIEHVGHDDDEETDDRNRDDRGDTEDESDEGDGSGSDEEDKVHVRSKVAEVNPLEEKEFERELRALMQAKAVELEEKQDIKRLALEYNDREEEKLNGLGNQLPSWTQSSGSRVAHRGNIWDAPGRGSGPRHC
ncbi:hypothetical protein K7X08_028667 [Anisodus acutangulus]|uniref:MIF4G domain-containing protein n=1 Tax=Anisodus acutangulus TaxID=402998 RepID=A0A9Q1LTM9_9SOLA|nr:hypothetical protein K7X08_028667 [Anisodus acutangulus]